MTLDIFRKLVLYKYEILFYQSLYPAFFFYLGFLSHDIHYSQDSRGRGRLFLIPFYHFHPLHEDLYISGTITSESPPLHIASDRTRTENLWFLSASPLTSKLSTCIQGIKIPSKQIPIFACLIMRGERGRRVKFHFRTDFITHSSLLGSLFIRVWSRKEIPLL